MNSTKIPKTKPWFTVERLFLAVVLISVFAMAARTPLDGDMWWHLRDGETTWQTGEVSAIDSFSYTRQGTTWTYHGWLSQVGLYLLYQIGSYRAISAGVALLAVLSMGLLYLQIEGNFILRAVVVVLAALVSSVVWSPRPQTTSLVMFALVGYLLYLYKWRGKNRLGWLIPIFILWSNLHGGYVLGLILVGTMIGGEVCNWALGWDGEEVLTWKQVRTLALWGLAGSLVVVLNPNGPDVWFIPFRTVGVNVLQSLISEWASPDFHQLAQQPLLWLLLLTFASVGISKRRLDGSDLASVSVFAYLALVSRRNYGPFALVTAPVLARHLANLFPAWKERLARQYPWVNKISKFGARSEQNINPTLQQSINVAILVLLSFAAIVKLIQVTEPEFVHQAEKQIFPVDAVAWIDENRPERNMFNDYNWGGYLVWHLRDYPVFVDGRTDLYGDEVLGEYLSVMQGNAAWQDILKKYNVRLVLVPTSDFALSRFSEAGWELVYEDDLAVVFEK
ncbi:MAG: hypothetical protein DRI56_00975 [Chloroflexota bacterium]|nr:MAG: hypothetical protein DRI56_00975 [Chloroflexota bacterium]